MGSKYMIYCSKYPIKYEFWDECYQTDSFFKMFMFMIKVKFKYDIIDIQIRDFNRMSD